MGQERKDCLVTGHTSVDSRHIQWKNQCMNLEIMGFLKKMKNNNYDGDNDDMKVVKLHMSKFSRGEMKVPLLECFEG